MWQNYLEIFLNQNKKNSENIQSLGITGLNKVGIELCCNATLEFSMFQEYFNGFNHR